MTWISTSVRGGRRRGGTSSTLGSPTTSTMGCRSWAGMLSHHPTALRLEEEGEEGGLLLPTCPARTLLSHYSIQMMITTTETSMETVTWLITMLYLKKLLMLWLIDFNQL